MKATVTAVVASFALLGAAAVIAQEAAPTVEITISGSKMTVAGADALKAGPTRLQFRAAGSSERGFALFELKPGVTRAELRAATPKIETPGDAHRYGRFVASSFVAGGRTYVTTVDLRAREHALVDFTKRPAVRGFFAAGPEASAAVGSTPAATVTMRDYAFAGDATLPRSGVVRLENTGRRIHHALLFRLRSGVNGRAVVRRLERGGEPRKAFAGPPTPLTELVSPDTVNDVETSSRPGRHVLVCFVQNSRRTPSHAELGMVRLVTVR